MKASDWIADRLAEEVDTVFAITGGAIVNLLDSIHKKGIRIVTMHHEQACAMAADAYARIRGFAVVIGTSGPGTTNMLTGTCCSYYDSVPVLTIGGQVPTKHLKKGGERQRGFQETDNVSIFKPITKLSKRVTDVKSDFNEAISVAKSGRPGPTFLEICDDTQRSEI